MYNKNSNLIILNPFIANISIIIYYGIIYSILFSYHIMVYIYYIKRAEVYILMVLM